MTCVSLCDRWPELDRQQLIASLRPPPGFANVTFDSYQPDPAVPSQSAAVLAMRQFADAVGAGKSRRPGRLRRRKGHTAQGGVYLDGGFGVGKTHLLAALWNETERTGTRAFASFVELTNLVGALGFEAAVDELSSMSLLCIDEFELDDPGDTVMMSTLAGRLAENGVALAATSNTLPDRLGEDRFAADDFLREIQGLADRFSVVRIDGQDYRHRDLRDPAPPLTDSEVAAALDSVRGVAAGDDFVGLMAHLARIHPSRYGTLISDVSAVGWCGVVQLTDQSTALRFVALVDRLYDHEVSVYSSGRPLVEVFDDEMLAGGYRKKYRRALSRLTALSRST